MSTGLWRHSRAPTSARSLSLLTEDVRLAMPPEPIEFRGRGSVGEFFKSFLSWGQKVKLVATRANGQPAFGYYLSTRPCRLSGATVSRSFP